MKAKIKDIIFYVIILLLVAIVMWQWISSDQTLKTLANYNAYNKQLQYLMGIGDLNSAHQHADIKVYINGKSIDFSQKKYQLTTNYLHFEDEDGNVIHTHAAGITIGQVIKGMGGTMTSECLVFEGQSYCNEKNYKLKIYVNGNSSN